MMVFSKGAETPVSKDFKAYEFDCPCDHCSQTFIESKLIDLLQALRDSVGFPVKVMSGYRCDFHQQQLKEQGFETAVGKSQHQDGCAADIKTGQHTGEELEKIARDVGFRAVGVGKQFIHADLRDDRYRRWAYSY